MTKTKTDKKVFRSWINRGERKFEIMSGKTGNVSQDAVEPLRDSIKRIISGGHKVEILPEDYDLNMLKDDVTKALKVEKGRPLTIYEIKDIRAKFTRHLIELKKREKNRTKAEPKDKSPEKDQKDEGKEEKPDEKK